MHTANTAGRRPPEVWRTPFLATGMMTFGAAAGTVTSLACDGPAPGSTAAWPSSDMLHRDGNLPTLINSVPFQQTYMGGIYLLQFCFPFQQTYMGV